MQDLSIFLAKHNLKFKDLSLLKEALTHPSYAYEMPKSSLCKDNQRLEYLGDSVLNLIINDYLFLHFPQYAEGKLTRLRSSLTCKESLARLATKLDLGEFLRLGRGEAKIGGKQRSSNLADCLEAFIGALYLDQGFAKTKECLCIWFQDELDKLHSPESVMDPKSRLQEMTQKDLQKVPMYEELSHSGPAHRKKFTVRVMIQDKEYGQGSDFSLKGAEQKAAAEALQRYRDRKLSKDISKSKASKEI